MSRTPANNQQASSSSSSNAKSSSGASSAAAAPHKLNGASSASSSAGAAINNLSSSSNPSPGPAASNWAKIAAGANNRATPAASPAATPQNASQQPLNPSGPAGRGSSGNRQPSASGGPAQASAASAAQNKKPSATDGAATASNNNKADSGKNVAPSAASSVKFGNVSDASSLASSTPGQASTPASSVSGKNMSFGSLPATQASSAAGTPGRDTPSGASSANSGKAVESAPAAPAATKAPTFDVASLDMNSFFQGGGGSPEASPTKETANAAPAASSGRLAAPHTQTLHSSSPASANANQQPPSFASSRRASTYDSPTTAALSPRTMAAQIPMQSTPHQQQFMQGGARPFSPAASSNLGKSGQPMPQGYTGYPSAGLPQTPSFASSGYGSPAQAGFVPNSPYNKPNGIVMNGGQPSGPNQQRNQQGGPAPQQNQQTQGQVPYINRNSSGLGHQHTRSLQAQSPRVAPAQQPAGMPYYPQQGYPGQPPYGQFPGGYYGYAPQGAYPPQYYQQGQQAPGSQHRPSILQQHSSQSGMSTPSSPAPSMRPSLSTAGSGSFTPGASTATQSGEPTHSSATTPAPSAGIASPTPSHASIPSAQFRHPSTPSHVHTPSFGQSMHHGPSTPSHFTPSSAHAQAFTPSSMSSPPPTAGLNAGAATFSFGAPRQMGGVSLGRPASKALVIKKPPPKDAAPADQDKDKSESEKADKTVEDKKEADALKAAEEKKVAEDKAAKEKAEKEAKAAEEKAAADAAAEKAKKEQEEKEQKEREEREKQELDEKLRQQEAEAKRVREEKDAEEKAAKEKEESDKAKAQEEEAARQAAEAEQKRLDETSAQTKADESKEAQPQPSTPSAPLTREPSQSSADESSVLASSTNDINAPSATKRAAPEPLDLSAAAAHGVSTESIVAPGSALSHARRIEDLSIVPYPDSINSPQPALNAKAKPGKFRYDRDFLLQFMAVCKEKPEQLPSLEAIGMTDEGSGGAGGVPIPRSASYGGKSRQGSVPSTPLAGRGPPNFNRAVSTGFAGMGNFSGVPATGLTSEQRFAQATANAGGLPGRPGSMARTPSAAGGFGGGIPMGGSSGRGADRSSGRGSRRPQGRAPPSAPTIPASDLVPLEMSENRWTPSVQAGGSSRNAPQDETAPEFVERKVKALLNKLTIENFDSISKQILAWADKSVQEQDGRILKQVIALIFEKATDEQTWSEVYAKLCLFLSAKVAAEVTDHSLLEANGQPATGGRLFRRYLLTRCQQDYEKGWAQKESATAAAKSKAADDKAKREAAEKEGEAAGVDKETAMKGVDFSDEYYAAEKAKRRGLGLVRFIGELYRIQMLKEKIMHECIKKLIANVDTPEEEDIESLCKLLLTVGRQLDEGKDTSAKYMNIYFERLKQIVANHCVTNRLEFMILDLMDTRKNGWKQRAGPTGPKSIADIHKDNVREKEEESRRSASQGRGLPPRNMGMERGGSRRGQGREGPGPDGWQAAQAAPRPQARAGDLSQLGKIRSTSGSPALAPGYVRGQGKQAAKEEAPAATSNPFALLDEGAAEPLSPPAEAKPQRVPLKLQPRTVSGAEDATDAPAAAEDEAEAEESEVVEEATGEMDESTKRSIQNSVKEYLGVRNIEEGKATFSDLPERHRGELAKAFIVKVVDGKAADVDAVVSLFEAVASASIVPPAMFRDAFVPTVTDLEDIATDAPKAYINTANLMAAAELSEEDFTTLQESMVSNEENLEGIQGDLKAAWEKATSSS